MKKYIEGLKTRSHAQKSQFAFAASAVLTGLIAAVWILTLITHPNSYIETEGSEVQNLANAGSLFDVFKEGF